MSTSLPQLVHGNVHHCSYRDDSGEPAESYLVVRPEGNILVDAPPLTDEFAAKLEELGGVSHLFLTGRGGAGDHAAYHSRFGCQRLVHSGDAHDDALRGVEQLIEGEESIDVDSELTIIPTPGNTEGAMCLLYQETYLFAGDHLAWSSEKGHLYAFQESCAHDWEIQSDSMRDLAAHEFEWVLPRHGERAYFEREMMRWRMEECIAWMEE